MHIVHYPLHENLGSNSFMVSKQSIALVNNGKLPEMKLVVVLGFSCLLARLFVCLFVCSIIGIQVTASTLGKYVQTAEAMKTSI